MLHLENLFFSVTVKTNENSHSKHSTLVHFDNNVICVYVNGLWSLCSVQQTKCCCSLTRSLFPCYIMRWMHNQQCTTTMPWNKKSSKQFFCFFLIPFLDGINRCCVLSVVKISWKRRTIYLRANITKERHNYGRIDLPLIRAAIHNKHTIRFHFTSFNRLMFNSVRIWLH